MYISVGQQNTKPFADLGRLKDELYIKTEHLIDERDEDGLSGMCGETIDKNGYSRLGNNDYMKLYLSNQTAREWDRVQYTKSLC